MTKLETSYGVFRAQNRINPRWIDFDKDLAKTHLANYGVVFVDPSYGTPIDDEYVLEECNKAYLKATTLKRSDRVVLKKGIKSTYRGKYATVVDPSIPTVKIDGKHETYALISSSQVQKVSCEVISLLDMSEGGRYLDCSFGLVWKAIKKIPNGMKLQLPNDYIKPDEVLVCINGLSSVILKKYPWKRNPILKKIARSQGLTNS